MTVAATGNKFSYAGNGSTVAFSYPRRFLADADLKVILVDAAGAENTQTIVTHYSVSGAGNPAGGTVTMVTAPAAGETLVLVRRTDQKQETDYVTGGVFSADGHETALDKLTLEVQDLQEQLDRAAQLRETSSSATPTLPEPVAGKVLQWPVSGTALENASLVPGPAGDAVFYDTRALVLLATVPAALNFLIIGGYANVGDGGAALYKRAGAEPAHAGKIQSADGAWWEFAEDAISVKQIGAVGDATALTSGSGADDTTAWNNAVNVAETLNIPIVIPPLASGLAYRLTSQITHAERVSYTGSGANVQVSAEAAPSLPDGGSWIYFDHTDEGLFFRDALEVGTSKAFCKLSGLGFCRNQPAPGAAWTPTANAYDIRCEFRLDIDDIVFLNATKAVLIRSAGQLRANSIRGQVFDVGFECERSSDLQRWNNIHWWPYWSADANVPAYTINNSIGFDIERADGLHITNSFCIDMHRFLRHTDAVVAGSGLAGFAFSNIYFDGGGGAFEFITNNYAAHGFINNFLHNSDPGSSGVGAAFDLSGTIASHVTIEGLNNTRSHAEVVRVTGAAHKVQVSPNRISSWDTLALGTVYAFHAADGAVIDLTSPPDFTTGTLFYQEATGGIINVPARTQQTVLVDNAIIRADGVHGTLQSSGILVDDSDNITRVASLGLKLSGTIYRDTQNNIIVVAGGNASNDGGNIVLYGSTHATQANDVTFRSGGAPRLQWDNSSAIWDFHSKDVSSINDLEIEGKFTAPNHPAFLAKRSANVTNVTGNSTAYTAIFDTERFDRGGDYNNTTGMFTAPVGGSYSIDATVRLTGITSACTGVQFLLVTSNHTYLVLYNDTGRLDPELSLQIKISAVDMDANDTAKIQIVGVGEASDVHDLIGGAPNAQTWFSGRLEQ